MLQIRWQIEMWLGFLLSLYLLLLVECEWDTSSWWVELGNGCVRE